MQYTEFENWLMANKGMSERGSHDLSSRVRRALKALDEEEVDEQTFARLYVSDAFKQYTVNVRSQVKRAITLYNEFTHEMGR